MIKERLIGYIEQSIKQNWDIEALSNYKEKGYTYKEIAEKILKFHLFFRDAGIKEGDKIAMVGRNSANWCVVYLAAVSYGAVIVPILPDFKPADIHFIVTHSDSVILFAEETLFKELNPEAMPLLRQILKIRDDSVLFSRIPHPPSPIPHPESLTP
jgi:long-chain acyl-CoA synthetase